MHTGGVKVRGVITGPYSRGQVTHLDYDHGYLAVGTREAVRVWRVREQELEEQPAHCLPGVHAWMLVLWWPALLVVGGEVWRAVQVWNLATHSMVRHLGQVEGRKWHNLHVRLLALLAPAPAILPLTAG